MISSSHVEHIRKPCRIFRLTDFGKITTAEEEDEEEKETSAPGKQEIRKINPATVPGMSPERKILQMTREPEPRCSSYFLFPLQAGLPACGSSYSTAPSHYAIA